jgi:hypothetical protein
MTSKSNTTKTNYRFANSPTKEGAYWNWDDVEVRPDHLGRGLGLFARRAIARGLLLPFNGALFVNQERFGIDDNHEYSFYTSLEKKGKSPVSAVVDPSPNIWECRNRYCATGFVNEPSGPFEKFNAAFFDLTHQNVVRWHLHTRPKYESFSPNATAFVLIVENVKEDEQIFLSYGSIYPRLYKAHAVAPNTFKTNRLPAVMKSNNYTEYQDHPQDGLAKSPFWSPDPLPPLQYESGSYNQWVSDMRFAAHRAQVPLPAWTRRPAAGLAGQIVWVCSEKKSLWRPAIITDMVMGPASGYKDITESTVVRVHAIRVDPSTRDYQLYSFAVRYANERACRPAHYEESGLISFQGPGAADAQDASPAYEFFAQCEPDMEDVPQSWKIAAPHLMGLAMNLRTWAKPHDWDERSQAQQLLEMCNSHTRAPEGSGDRTVDVRQLNPWQPIWHKDEIFMVVRVRTDAPAAAWALNMYELKECSDEDLAAGLSAVKIDVRETYTKGGLLEPAWQLAFRDELVDDGDDEEDEDMSGRLLSSYAYKPLVRCAQRAVKNDNSLKSPTRTQTSALYIAIQKKLSDFVTTEQSFRHRPPPRAGTIDLPLERLRTVSFDFLVKDDKTIVYILSWRVTVNAITSVLLPHATLIIKQSDRCFFASNALDDNVFVPVDLGADVIKVTARGAELVNLKPYAPYPVHPPPLRSLKDYADNPLPVGPLTLVPNQIFAQQGILDVFTDIYSVLDRLVQKDSSLPASEREVNLPVSLLEHGKFEIREGWEARIVAWSLEEKETTRPKGRDEILRSPSAPKTKAPRCVMRVRIPGKPEYVVGNPGDAYVLVPPAQARPQLLVTHAGVTYLS